MPLGCAAVSAGPRPRLRQLAEAVFLAAASLRMTLVVHEVAPYEQVCVVAVVGRPFLQDAFSGPSAPQWKHHVAVRFFDLTCHDAAADAVSG